MMVDRVKQILLDWSVTDEDDLEEFFQEAFLESRDGCLPGCWTSDDVHEEIVNMYKVLYEPVLQEIAERTGIPAYLLQSVIEPNIEDTSWVVLLYNASRAAGHPPLMLHYLSQKAWYCYWESADEMEADLQAIVSDAIAKLVKANIPMKPDAVLAAAR